MVESSVFRKKFFVAIIIVIILFLSIKFVGFLFGIGISIPPNICDMKIGYELHGDVFYSSRDLCLLELGKTEVSAQICNEIGTYFLHRDCITAIAIQKNDTTICEYVRKNYDYGRPDLDKWECVKEVAINTYNLSLCAEIEYGDVRGPCLTGVAQIEKEERNYEEEALTLANSNLTAAIMKCQQFKEPVNRKNCYASVSDAFSGINLENRFSPPQILIDICLNEPNQYEWLACLYGNVFDSLTAIDRFVPQFKEKVKSDQYKINTYCELFVYEPGNPGKGSYYGEAGKLRDEIC